MRTYIHKNVIDNEYLHSLSDIKTNKIKYKFELEQTLKKFENVIIWHKNRKGNSFFLTSYIYICIYIKKRIDNLK